MDPEGGVEEGEGRLGNAPKLRRGRVAAVRQSYGVRRWGRGLGRTRWAGRCGRRGAEIDAQRSEANFPLPPVAPRPPRIAAVRPWGRRGFVIAAAGPFSIEVILVPGVSLPVRIVPRVPRRPPVRRRGAKPAGSGIGVGSVARGRVREGDRAPASSRGWTRGRTIGFDGAFAVRRRRRVTRVRGDVGGGVGGRNLLAGAAAELVVRGQELGHRYELQRLEHPATR